MDNLKNQIFEKLNEDENEYIINLIDKLDNINQYRRTYYQNNKEKIKNYQKQYYSENREEKKKAMLQRYYKKKIEEQQKNLL
jgi:hypothetical protein